MCGAESYRCYFRVGPQRCFFVLFGGRIVPGGGIHNVLRVVNLVPYSIFVVFVSGVGI